MLTKTLTLSDLTLFGITSILGSGGFNLIGNALAEGGYKSALTLGASGALFLGSAYSYSYAREKYNSNTSETELIESVLGSIGKNVSIFSILFYNIFAIATILVFCSKLLFPNVSSFHQISFSLMLLGLMTLAAFQKLEFNKTVINLFSYGIILLLLIISYFGISNELPLETKFPKLNMFESFLFFFFVLAGHDALIKFTEEANNGSDVDKSMYYSIIISILLTAGVCLAALHYIDFKNDNIENSLAIIFERAFNSKSGKYITIISLLFMVVTTFLGYLATTRYIYKLPYDFVKGDGDGNVSSISIIIVSILSALAILINSTTSLVTYTDMALIVTLVLVSSSTFIDKYNKKKELSLIDAGSTLGFILVLLLAFNR